MVDVRNSGPLDYIRYVLSALLLLFSAIVTFYAIIERKTRFWHVVPGWAALILFIVDLFILGIVEGLQIALVELKRQHPESYKKTHPAAYRLGVISSKGDNVERFLMGRQVFVVVLVFFCAKLTTIHLEEGEHFLFPAPFWVRAVFLETGILACIVVVIVAQLMPQIVAAKYPVHFLQFFIMRPAYYMCVFVEISGITHICWVLSFLVTIATRMKDDKTTINPNEIGSAEDVLDKIDGSLDGITVTTAGSNSSNNSHSRDNLNKYAPLPTENMKYDQAGKYTALVQKMNKTVSPDTMKVLRLYLDQHPEKFSQFPSVVGGKMYPAPFALASQLQEDGHEVPKFLTDISNPDHIPPHIVAFELLAENRTLQDEIEFLKKKLDSVTKEN